MGERASRRKFLKTVAAGFAMGCSSGGTTSQAASELSRRLENLDNYADKSMAAWSLPGLAIAVVKDGKVVHLRGYGVRRLGHDDRVDEKTIFPIGSATKSFTAAAVGRLVDRKKIQWDDSVLGYLPKLGIDRRITIRHLIRHRSGLPTDNMLWRSGALNAEEILARLHLVEPVAAPGERFVYNNNMYLVAGKIVERVSGRRWSEYLRAEIFAPLAMKTTYADSSGIQSLENVATPHAAIAEKLQPIERYSPDVIAPAGAIHSNISDLTQWLLLHLEREVQGKIPILSHIRLEEMHAAPAELAIDTKPRKPKTPHAPISHYGLGWFFNDYHGNTIVEHSGTLNGFVAWIAMVPSDRFGFVILANSHRTGLNYALRSWLMDAYFGLAERDQSETVRLDYENGYKRLLREAKDKFDARRTIRTSASHPIDAYAGTYNSDLYGSIFVTAKDEHLALRFGSRFHGRLMHRGEESFRVAFDEPLHEDWQVTFQNSKRVVTAMNVKEAPWAPDSYEDAEDLGRFERR